MNARFAHVFSRLSLVSVVAVSALGAAACNNGRTTEAAPVVAAEQAKAAPAAGQHGPGYRLFRQIEALDLRPAQRAAVAEVEQNLAADLSPHRETVRQVAHTLATGIQNGQIDPEVSAAQQAALTAAMADANASFAAAMNEVHDALDAGQRATLVERLRAQRFGEHGRHARAEGEHESGPMAKVAFELGLTEEQKQSLREAVQKGTEDIFPDRKVRREAWEAKMKALGDAFVTDDFDAADFELGGGGDQAIRAFNEAVTRAIDVSGKVLSDDQRLLVAAMIREKAQKI